MDEGQVMSSLDGIVRSTDNVLANLLWVFASLLALLIVLMLWNIFSRAATGIGARVSNLFLKVRVAPAGDSHLRSLDMRTATIYTSQRLLKGQSVEFDVSSLPNFPAKDVVLPAKVAAVSQVPGSDAFIAKIEFSDPQHAVVKSLRGYISQLAKASAGR
jgi:hypothetical protein